MTKKTKAELEEIIEDLECEVDYYERSWDETYQELHKQILLRNMGWATAVVLATLIIAVFMLQHYRIGLWI